MAVAYVRPNSTRTTATSLPMTVARSTVGIVCIGFLSAHFTVAMAAIVYSDATPNPTNAPARPLQPPNTTLMMIPAGMMAAPAIATAWASPLLNLSKSLSGWSPSPLSPAVSAISLDLSTRPSIYLENGARLFFVSVVLALFILLARRPVPAGRAVAPDDARYRSDEEADDGEPEDHPEELVVGHELERKAGAAQQRGPEIEKDHRLALAVAHVQKSVMYVLFVRVRDGDALA